MTIYKAINTLGKFLSLRDVPILTSDALNKTYGFEQVDVFILLGNAITYTIEAAAQAYSNGVCKKLMICGGIGHSTSFLKEAMQNHSVYGRLNFNECQAEADMIKQVMRHIYHVPECDLIIENQSTNCGDNAIKAIEKLEELGVEYKSLLLMQDPTMQRRSHASFLKVLEGKPQVNILSYAPFIPEMNQELELENENIDGLWHKERYLELILGEIPRLRDDKNGYGPKGRGYIAHVDIPHEIEEAYNSVRNALLEHQNRVL